MSPLGAYRTVDYHVAGEPFRIVVEGAPALPGATMGERRAAARTTDVLDAHRRFLAHEPRGHADMYGAYVYEGVEGTDFAAVFWHTEGYPPSCAHGTLALAAWAIESQRVPAPFDGEARVAIATPAGLARARVIMGGGRIAGIALESSVAHPVERGVRVALADRVLRVDLAFGGAVFAVVEARDAGVRIEPDGVRALVALGREVRRTLNERSAVVPDEADPRLSGVFGVTFVDPIGPRVDRTVTVFNDGWVDRSPCLPAVAARVSLLAADGLLGPRDRMRHECIVGASYWSTLLEVSPSGVVVDIVGSAHRTGEHVFAPAPGDPLAGGFLLRAGPPGPAVPTARL